MRRDPTEFRKRFLKWKSGAKPYLYGIPYEDDNHNLDYDQARANQLGYTADETGHYPTRDYETGRYLKSVAHPTVSKSIYTDMGLGYDVFYNLKDGLLYLQPNWGNSYKDRLPKYNDGKPEYKYVQAGADNSWSRITNDSNGDVFANLVVTPSKVKLNADRLYNSEPINSSANIKARSIPVPRSIHQEPGLEITSPEFDILALGAGSRINAATQTFLKSRKIANAIAKGIKENAIITGYNRNPVTKEIGTLWDYQSYLDNVFPNSKIKDVLWHGSTSKNLQYFSPKYIGSNAPIKKSVGMYLAPERTTAASYGKKGSVYPVLLNTENPFVTDQIFGGISKNGINVARISPKTKSTILANNDAVIAPARGEIAFFEPNNALILGSEKDVEGFRKFVSSPRITAENATSMTPANREVNQMMIPSLDIDRLKRAIDRQIAENQWKGLLRGEEDVFNYLGSEKHINRIMESGVPREKATKIAQDMRDNAMATDRAIDYTGGEGAYHNVGEYDNGFFNHHRRTLNPKYTVMKGLDEQSTYENVIHELGGHGASLGYRPGSYSNINERAAKWYEDAMTEWSPYHKEVYEHNSLLKPIRKSEYVGVKDPHIEYLEGVDEYSARARAANIQNDKRADFSELYKYFTKESVDKLKNSVWGLLPFGIGLTGYGLFNNQEALLNYYTQNELRNK